MFSCFQSNESKHPLMFDCESVTRQVRSLQLREAVQLMAGGNLKFNLQPLLKRRLMTVLLKLKRFY